LCIVVTGMGVVSGFGNGLDSLADALFFGQSSIRPNDLFPELDGKRSNVGYVPGVPETVVARADHFLRLSVSEALRHARVSAPLAELPVFLGSLHGNLDAWCHSRRAGIDVKPGLWELGSDLWPTLANRVSITTVTTGCTASAVAIGLALDHLRAGHSQLAVVAGCEGLTPFLLEGFKALRSLAKENCRPFDVQRDGLVLGEGAAALVLETSEHARKRGVQPIVEIAGFGLASDGTHFTAPDLEGKGAAAALRCAVADAALVRAPDSINVHGTGTRYNDQMECVALKTVFGEDAGKIAITSTKPVLGHLFGAAGGVEVLCSILSMVRNQVPPILTLQELDPEFAEFDFVRGCNRELVQESVISMNSAFGGTNSAVVLRRIS
jgi:3-oxoacyl-[acyl-carrier-protein] synthase II